MRGWKSGEEIIFLNTYSLAEIMVRNNYIFFQILFMVSVWVSGLGDFTFFKVQANFFRFAGGLFFKNPNPKLPKSAKKDFRY